MRDSEITSVSNEIDGINALSSEMLSSWKVRKLDTIVIPEIKKKAKVNRPPVLVLRYVTGVLSSVL